MPSENQSRGPYPHERAGGTALSPADAARLQLSLPIALPAWLLEELSQKPLLGARLELTLAPAAPQPKLPKRRHESSAAIFICVFDAERIIEEALGFARGLYLVAGGYLPIAGCGFRGTTMYATSLSSPSGLHFVDEPRDQESPVLMPLTSEGGVLVTLPALLDIARPQASASLRQRLPKRRSLVTARRASRRGPTRRASSLPLFD